MSDVTIVEVSPRDGLQNEGTILSTDAKVELITRLADAGATRIEAVSFAHPKLVPTMADAEDVMARVPRRDGVSYAGLILNRKGLDRAEGAGVDEVNVVVCVSDSFSERNQRVNADEAMRMAADVVAAARDRGLFTTITLATAFGCPFEGEVDPARVAEFARRSVDAGAQELCLADTVGVGAPNQVHDLTARFRDVLGAPDSGGPALRYHFHNTRNTGFANAATAVAEGVDVLDASAGGIGGCPFAPKATGNIATDDLVYMLERMGRPTGIDLSALLPTAGFLSDQLGHEVPALVPRAGMFPVTGGTVVGKILAAHLRGGELGAGNDVTVAVDQVLIEDATGTMCAMQFEQLGQGSDTAPAVAVPLAVMYVDHNVLQIDDKNMQDHRYLRSFSQRYGLLFSPPGHGISHYVHLERFARPGGLLLGADSHSTMAGAVGMFATGAGGLEVAVAMAGYGFDLPCPRVHGVELTGELPPGVEAKDVILELLRRHGVRGGRGAAFEFFGSGVATLSTTERATICNMVVETGATAGVFPADEETRRWLTAQDRGDEFVPLAADPDAAYDEVERIDLAALEPLVALPPSPGNVVPVREAAGTPVVQVCVGSSVNSSYEDLASVAAMLRDRAVAPGVVLTVTPGSRQILDTIISSGVYGDLFTAGARMLEPVCGPCVGIGQAPVKGRPSLRTFNRNFPGRSGTAGDAVYLCSPSTAAASALAGAITDPRGAERPPLRAAAPPDTSIHDHHLVWPPPADERAGIEVERGENLVPPPPPDPMPDEVDGRVLIVVPDDVSTGDMAPDGAIAMSVWSNIAACAEFMFLRFDPEFPARAQEWGGGLIVGGHNYGQGSSREHAALAPLHLGVRAIVAGSYARIHRRNLIAVGIVPLVIADDDREAVEVGQHWHIAGLAEAVRSGADGVTARVDDARDVHLELQLSPGERAVLAAGGLLAHVRAGARPAVDPIPTP